ncbi:MAG: helix-turn-helix transcriptional regulator [Pseudomonadota bacterium]
MPGENFRARIERLLAEQNYTQRELAKKMGISEQGFSNIKTRNRPNPKTIHKLSKALQIPCDYFLD